MSTSLTQIDTTATSVGTDSAERTGRRPAEIARNLEASQTGSPIKSEQPFGKPQTARPISIDLLYQAREAGSPSFNRGIELLGDACDCLSEAKRAIEQDDRIACASELLKFDGILRGLFECRAIGEGFANVINSIHLSILNLEDLPLNNAQITTLWRVMRELSVAPFLSFPQSLEMVRQLKNVGLNINNSFLVEWVSEHSTLGDEESIR